MVESQVAICTNLAARPGRSILIVLGLHNTFAKNVSCSFHAFTASAFSALCKILRSVAANSSDISIKEP